MNACDGLLWAMDEGKKRRGHCRRADSSLCTPRNIAQRQKITTSGQNPLVLNETRKQREAAFLRDAMTHGPSPRLMQERQAATRDSYISTSHPELRCQTLPSSSIHKPLSTTAFIASSLSDSSNTPNFSNQPHHNHIQNDWRKVWRKGLWRQEQRSIVSRIHSRTFTISSIAFGCL